MYSLIAILSLSLLIILHEAGHMWVAQACGMRILQFAVGLGPVIWQKVHKGIAFSWALLPIGGFVEIAGMDAKYAHAEEHIDPKTFFIHKPWWQRVAVILAGPLMNLVIGAFLLGFLATTIGIKTYRPESARLGEVFRGSAADKAGLHEGDWVKAIDGTAVVRWEDLVGIVRKHPGKRLVFDIQRDSEQHSISVVPEEKNHQGFLGAGVYAERLRVAWWAGFYVGTQHMLQTAYEQISQICGLILGQHSAGGARMVGIPEIFNITRQQAERGIFELLYTLAMLSIGLGCMNLLPIPSLDGGRMLFLVFEKLSPISISKKIEEYFHQMGFVLLMGLMLWISFRDFF
jgi:regulator of sigma E protease